MTTTNNYADVLSKSVEYFNGDELAAKVFVDKYALRDDDDHLLEETPTDMFRRIAKELARIEATKFKTPFTEDEIFSWMDHFKYIVLQGSCLFGIGNPYQYVSLSNCFVLDHPLDSYNSILDTDRQLINISKRRGGCGIDISHLRPQGARTHNSSKSSTGPISFANRFSNSIREVGQEGRRGALMITISVHHPDVVKFIHCKEDKTKITGANLSIRLTNEFLDAVRKDTEYEQRWPVNAKKPKIKKKVKARDIWDDIVKAAHANAEPGILFWDNILTESPADCYEDYQTTGTNPCSELPLCSLDSCRLGLLRLLSFVINAFTPNAYFDFASFYTFAQRLQRIMDDVIDLELKCIDKIIDKIRRDPEPEYLKQDELRLWNQIRTKCKEGRRTGCGLTGLADTFAALGIKYGSDESIQLTDEIYKTLKFGCYRSSVDMAMELGAFGPWEYELEKDNPFLKRFQSERIFIDEQIGVPVCYEGGDIYDDMCQYGRRNIACLTSAPAGSMSMLTQTTSGIEPLFQQHYKRRKKGNHTDKGFRVDFTDASGDTWMEFVVFHPQVQAWMNACSKNGLVIDQSPWNGCCAEDLNWKIRVELQATAQKHIDHAISSTINLPEDATVEQVGEIYQTAWEAGCKGITVYRKNCRTGVLVDSSLDKPTKRGIIRTEAPKRPKELPCDIHHVTVQGKKYFVLVGKMGDDPYEVFAGRNGFLDKSIKTGKIIRRRKGYYQAEFDESDVSLSPITAASSETEEAITRLASGMLRHGANILYVVAQLEKVGEKGDMHNFAIALSRALKKYIKDGEEEKDESCPECKGKIIRQEGCKTCKGCGWSKCL